MGDGKDSDFDPDFKNGNSVENLVTLRRSRSGFIGHITTHYVTKLMKNCLWMIALKQLNV